ncbi:MAG: hypothetical protein ACFFF9_04110 [Candidatus Thorarchaeota archaeon]
MSEHNSDRIIVAKDNLARCQWCGTPESPYWTISRDEQLFCSRECELAASATTKRIGGCVSTFCGSLFLIPLLYFMFVFPSNFLGATMVFLLLGVPFLAIGIYEYTEGTEGLKYKDREDRYRGVSPIVCTYCSHQNPPNVMACQNCGSTLAEAPFVKDSTPPWFIQGKSRGVYRCPHCKAVYSYRQAPISKDGEVTCQNCLKPFFRPRDDQ